MICAYPNDDTKPELSATYDSETMTGFEYESESPSRDSRHEIERGNPYARSMRSSYSSLHAFSGFDYDSVEGLVEINPVRLTEETNRAFWSLDMGWGILEHSPLQVRIEVLSGKLSLRMLKLPERQIEAIERIRWGGVILQYEIDGQEIHFGGQFTLNDKKPLVIELADELR